MKAIAKRIIQLLDNEPFSSQTEAAEVIGIKQQTISSLKSTGTLALPTLLKFVDYFQFTSLDWIVSGIGAQTQSTSFIHVTDMKVAAKGLKVSHKYRLPELLKDRCRDDYDYYGHTIMSNDLHPEISASDFVLLDFVSHHNLDFLEQDSLCAIVYRNGTTIWRKVRFIEDKILFMTSKDGIEPLEYNKKDVKFIYPIKGIWKGMDLE